VFLPLKGEIFADLRRICQPNLHESKAELLIAFACAYVDLSVRREKPLSGESRFRELLSCPALDLCRKCLEVVELYGNLPS